MVWLSPRKTVGKEGAMGKEPEWAATSPVLCRGLGSWQQWWVFNVSLWLIPIVWNASMLETFYYDPLPLSGHALSLLNRFHLHCIIREQRKSMNLCIEQSVYVCEHTLLWRIGSAGLYIHACISCSGAGREEDDGLMSRAPDCGPGSICSKVLWELEAKCSFLAFNCISTS